MNGDRLIVSFCVEPEYDGWRLDAYLAAKIPRLSRTRIQSILRESLLPPPGRALRPSSLVRPGLRFALDRPAPEEPEPLVPRTVFEDEALLVLDKPAGLAVHPTARYHRCTLTAVLRRRPDRADPAHRLDRETSGLLVCGKGPAATAALKRAFAEGRVEKRYLAIVEGWPADDRFAVDLPMQLGRGTVRIRMEVGRGKPARSEVEVRGRLLASDGARFALVEVRPRTGRQHQIRAHLAAVGHPVVGDKMYGFDEACFLRFVGGELSEGDRGRLRLPRQALHAHALALSHPVTGRCAAWESPLPPDLHDFLASLQAP